MAAPVNAPQFTVADFSAPSDPTSVVYRDDAPQVSTLLRFPSDTPMYYTKIGVYEYQRQSWASVGTLGEPQSTLVLPMPERLVDAQSARFNTMPIGATGAAATWIAGGAGPTQNIKNALDAIWNATGKSDQNKSVVNQLGAKALAEAAGAALGSVGSAASAGAQAALGYSLNDFLTVIYEGPNYKTFEMTWKMSPRTRAESQAIKNMELVLKNAQAPSWAGGLELFFRWPRIFMIEFGYQNDTSVMGDRLYRFKPAMLVNAAFNYAPGGVPAFYAASQFPEGVAVSLQFTEIELWVNSSGAQDAYPG